MIIKKLTNIVLLTAIICFSCLPCFAVENLPALKRGYENYQKGNYAQAAVEIDDYLVDNPRDYNTICLLGMVLIKKGDIADATQVFKIAAELEPDKWEAYGFLGEIYDTLKDFDNAIDYYGKTLAVKCIDNNSKAYYTDLREKAKAKLAKKKESTTVAQN